MKQKRFTEEQIIWIFKQAQAGMKIVDLCRTHGVSPATFYNRRSKYGGMEISYARRLKTLETSVDDEEAIVGMHKATLDNLGY